MVGVEVRDQGEVDVGKPGGRAQHLTLRALAAVDQDALAPAADAVGGRSALRGRYGPRRAQAEDIEVHGEPVGFGESAFSMSAAETPRMQAGPGWHAAPSATARART